MVALGCWLQWQVEVAVVKRTTALAAVYVEGIIAAHLRSSALELPLDDATRGEFDRQFRNGPLRREVVSVKLWGEDGTVLYSSDSSQTGLRFPVGARLAAAFGGTVQASLSRLQDPDNVPERRHSDRLMEIYVPVHADGSGPVALVAEFYHSTESLSREVAAATLRGWLLVVATTAATFVLLWGMVRRADRTISEQQRDLRDQLQQLRASLEENERMRRQLREAGERAAALNEQFLHRVAADLHDGPAQDLALALMRLEALAETDDDGALAKESTRQDFHTIRGALAAGLDELRAIARGLGNPGLEPLTLSDTVRRAVRNHERRSGKHVALEIDAGPEEAPLAVKTTLYRLLQESLANGWVHAEGRGQRVRFRRGGDSLQVEVSDEGPGFDAGLDYSSAGRFGLAFMQQRVSMLGGRFEIDSAPGRGTRITATIPMSLREAIHA
jgi:hypothetical protein